MIGSRVRPLIGLCVLGCVLCVARLAEIQLREHERWSGEAARLVRTGRVLPYRRGRVLDADGRVLARDADTYALALVYRDFRRGHPLGQVAHARSLLESRAVPLGEARRNAVAWALELVRLSPRALAAFGEGEGVDLATLRVPPAPERERRADRASDLRFYVRRLLGLEPREWKTLLERARGEDGDPSFVALAARARANDVGTLERELAGRVAASIADLERLAALVDWSADDAPAALAPLERILVELEDARRWVEDATASKLFAEAAGFAPGRIAPETLVAEIDLGWIRRLLAWDEARLAEWARTARAAWTGNWRDGYALPRLCAELQLDPAQAPDPERVLSQLATLYRSEEAVDRALDGDPPSWRELSEPVVLARLSELFDAPPTAGLAAIAARALPLQDPALVREPPSWALVDALAPADAGGEPIGRALGRLFADGDRHDADEVLRLARELVDGWEVAFQGALARGLAELCAAAEAAGELAPGARLRLAPALRERAAERAEYYLKDYGSRPRPLQRERPDYEVVYLLTRFRERYPGFEARESRVRVYTDQPGEFPRPAASLIGTVSAVDVFDLQRQRDRAQRLRELWNRPRRSLDEELELQKLVGSVVLSDEVRGVSGVEGFWDPELRGRNGYLESRGLQDVFGGGEERRSVTEPEDGWDVRLTLDLDLQVAARRTLAHPEIVADPRFDEAWAASPVGAIVLVTPEGDVLAAASEPDEDSDVGAGARGQRGVVLDRTLRRPTFQPLGSVFKPFVAIHALDRIGLDPGMRVDCAPIERGGCGYVDVRCHAASGHGEVDLRQALVRSCNAYFARLGEMLSTDDFRAVAEDFGFGRPTGVRTPPPWDSGLRPRLGLVENTYPRLFRAPLEGIAKRLAGNGLAVVEGTPMQLARAMAGLATGRLPELRLVERVGARELRRAEATPVPIAGEHLELVRAALRGVTNESDGTAHAALSRARVGLRIAVKTGSADLTSRSADDEPRIRKHTWVGGWAPAEDPALVFVVFVHDTATTSSHGAVYVVRQLLRQPEVHAWLAERGVALDAAAEEAR